MLLSDRPFLTVVSGIPRSGTSLMMSMLDSGGIPVLVDNIRAADVDNPRSAGIAVGDARTAGKAHTGR